jgi:hypothetical protein
MDTASHPSSSPCVRTCRFRHLLRLLPLLLLAVVLSWPGAPPAIAASGASFVLTWDEQSCLPPPPGAVEALRYAATLWGEQLRSPAPIRVRACWSASVPAGALGTGDAVAYLQNFAGAPLADSYYPVALASALAGRDLLPEQDAIKVNFKADEPWSFATAVPDGAGTDFVVVALHELGHGLGFNAFMYESYNVGFCGGPLGFYYAFCPTPYDRLAVDGAGTPLLSLLLPDPRVLGARLKGDAYFGGPNARAANGEQPARLYAPPIWDEGSSLVHLDTSFGTTPNALMTPSVGTALRHPGPLTLAMLRDMGWPLAGDGPAVALAGPIAVPVGQPASLSASLDWPAYAGQPVTFSWRASGQAEQTRTGAALSDTLELSWAAPGYQLISAGATVDGAADFATRSLLVVDVMLEAEERGLVGQPASFSARLLPADTALPVSYRWQASGQAEQLHSAQGTSDSAQWTWRAPGTMTVSVTATIGGAEVTAARTIMIEGASLGWQVFLPSIVR